MLRWIKTAVLLIPFCLSMIGCGKASTAWQEQYDLGMRYLDVGEYEQAIVAFSAAIEIDPNQAAAYLNRADAYTGREQTWTNMQAAREDYTKTLELNDKNVDAYLALTNLYVYQGKIEQAKDVLRTAVSKVQDDRIEEKQKELDSGEIYNRMGQLLYRCGYDENGERAWYHIFSYDSDGKQTGLRVYNADGEETDFVEYQYDEEGKVIQDAGYSADGTIRSAEYGYDEKGNIAYSEGEEESENAVFSYDDQGRRTERREQGEDGMVTTYTYNEEDQLIRTDDYAQDELLGYTLYEYDEQGNQISESTYSPDGTLRERLVSEWDEDGNIVSENIYDGDGNLLSSGSEW